MNTDTATARSVRLNAGMTRQELRDFGRRWGRSKATAKAAAPLAPRDYVVCDCHGLRWDVLDVRFGDTNTCPLD